MWSALGKALSKTPKVRPTLPAVATPAPGDAAAASFAGLTTKLDYLDAGDIKRVREAYRFADEAHLGQFRASGEPTSRIRSRSLGCAPSGSSTRKPSWPR